MSFCPAAVVIPGDVGAAREILARILRRKSFWDSLMDIAEAAAGPNYGVVFTAHHADGRVTGRISRLRATGQVIATATRIDKKVTVI